MPLQCDTFVFEQLEQLFHQVNGTMLSAGAANRHRDVAAVIACQRVKPVLQKLLNLFKHLRDVWLLLEKAG